MGFGVGLGAKWKARQSGKQNSTINWHAIHGGGGAFDFGGGAFVAELYLFAKRVKASQYQ